MNADLLKKAGFSTRAIHSGEKANETGSVAVPIYQSATFEFKNTAHAARVMGREEKGYIYSRGLNPTTEVLEEKLADLEGGEAALAQSSGMAAISTALLTEAGAGDHVIADKRGAKVFVDNTYMTPYFQQPLMLGADLVVHSLH